MAASDADADVHPDCLLSDPNVRATTEEGSEGRSRSKRGRDAESYADCWAGGAERGEAGEEVVWCVSECFAFSLRNGGQEVREWRI